MGEEFQWNFPLRMADNVDLDKDINKKIKSNLQEVPVLDDIVKTLLVLQTAITTDHQIEIFQEKNLYRYLVYTSVKHLENIVERSPYSKDITEGKNSLIGRR